MLTLDNKIPIIDLEYIALKYNIQFHMSTLDRGITDI